jgi:ribose transport system permease protein
MMTSERLRRLRSIYWLPPLAVLLVLIVLNLVVDPGLLEPAYLPSMLAAFAPLAILAMASTPAILSGGGGIDISLPSLSVFTSVVVVTVVLPHDVIGGPVPTILIAIACGAVVGTISGLLVTILRYQPILATLCGMFILTGMNLKAAPIPIPAGDNWTAGLSDAVGGLPIALVMILAPLLVWLVLSRTAWARNLYSVGGDQVAAFSAGIPVARVRLFAYALGGSFAGLGGIALLGVIRAADATIATQYMIFALTAVALGGTSFVGGSGGLVGSLIGAGSIFLLQVLLTSLGLPSAWLQVAFGAFLLIAVVASHTLVKGGSHQ